MGDPPDSFGVERCVIDGREVLTFRIVHEPGRALSDNVWSKLVGVLGEMVFDEVLVPQEMQKGVR